MTGVEHDLPRVQSVPGQQDLPYWADDTSTLILGDAAAVLGRLPQASVDCVVTSPPYWGLRDYGVAGQVGQEESPAAYVKALRTVFAECARVLKPTGTCWVNLGDAYVSAAGGAPTSGNPSTNGGARVVRPRAQDYLPPKNMLGLPWRMAFSLQDDGWLLRNAIVWHKPNAMPESVRDRLSTRHELLFLLTRSSHYFFDLNPIREKSRPQPGLAGTFRRPAPSTPLVPGQSATQHRADRPDVPAYTEAGRNPGDVWSIATTPSRREHYAAFPVEIPRRCVASGCPEDGVVLDPFSGTGTTGEAARRLGRRYIGVDISPAYLDIQVQRFAQSVIA